MGSFNTQGVFVQNQQLKLSLQGHQSLGGLSYLSPLLSTIRTW